MPFNASIRIFACGRQIKRHFILRDGEPAILGEQIFTWIKESYYDSDRRAALCSEFDELAPSNDYYESISHTFRDYAYVIDLDEASIRIFCGDDGSGSSGLFAELSFRKIASSRPAKLAAKCQRKADLLK